MEESRYLDFKEVNQSRNKRKRIFVVDKVRGRGLLGTILWNGSIQQYVFRPGGFSPVFSRGWLREIADCISELSNQRLDKNYA